MFGNVFKLALKATLFASIFPSIVSTAPLDLQDRGIEKRANEFPPPDIIQRFYMRPAQRRPARPLVFYNVDSTRLNRQQIQQIAARNFALSLYDVYQPDDWLIDPPFNQNRGAYYYYEQRGELRDWFRYTSRIFAQVGTNNVAYLIWDGERPFENFTPANLPQPNAWWHAIWATDEFDAILRGQTAIDTVYLIDPETGVVQGSPFWRRGQPPPTGWQYTMSGANRDSDDTANEHPTGPSGQSKRGASPADAISTDVEAWSEYLDAVRAAHRFNETLTKRADTVDGIEQRPDQAIFTPGQDAPWVAGTCNFNWSQVITVSEASRSSVSAFAVTLYDDQKTSTIGGVTNQVIQDGSSYSMPSRLPYTLVITYHDDQDQTINFAYAGMNWSSKSSQCTTGGFGGDARRSGYCTFACNQFQ